MSRCSRFVAFRCRVGVHRWFYSNMDLPLHCKDCRANFWREFKRALARQEPTEQKKGVFELVAGLSEVNPQHLSDFKKAMTEKVIPEIVKVVEERRLSAAESRHWQLKC